MMTLPKEKWHQQISDYHILFIKGGWLVDKSNRPLLFVNQENRGGVKYPPSVKNTPSQIGLIEHFCFRKMDNNSRKESIVYRIATIFCLLAADILKMVSFLQIVAFSTMDLLYNRIILCNRTISPLVLFIFTAVVFGFFYLIYFRLVIKALDIGQFSWWMCRKNEIRTKVLSLKSSNFSKFYPNPLKLCTCWETKPLHKSVPGNSINVTH